MTTMLRLLGVLLCAVVAYAELLPQKDFNVEGMAGKWYMIGFATNAQWFVSRKSEMKMGTAVFEPTAEGNLDTTYANLNSDGSCWRMNNLAKKTDLPGRFTFHNKRWNNDNDMRVVEVKYDDYALTHTIKTKGGETEVLNKLYSRTTEASSELQHKFKVMSLDSGILAENIVILPKNDECPPA